MTVSKTHDIVFKLARILDLDLPELHLPSQPKPAKSSAILTTKNLTYNHRKPPTHIHYIKPTEHHRNTEQMPRKTMYYCLILKETNDDN